MFGMPQLILLSLLFLSKTAAKVLLFYELHNITENYMENKKINGLINGNYMENNRELYGEQQK